MSNSHPILKMFYISLGQKGFATASLVAATHLQAGGTTYRATSNLWAQLSDSPEVQHCDRYLQWGFMCGSGRMTTGRFELRKREKARASGHDVRGEAGLDTHIEPTERRG
jgi:hypothetical protein